MTFTDLIKLRIIILNKSKMQNQITLGYWNIRGRGQVLRLLLAYTGLEWTEKTYTGPETWFGSGDKQKLGLDFPNLPYLVKGDFKLTESSAIAKYIVKISSKKQLLGKSAQDEARVDMILSLLDEIFNPTMALFFSPNHKTQQKRLFDGKIKDKLDQLQGFCGQKGHALDYLTIADFKICEASYYFQKLYEDQYKNYPFLAAIRKTVENLSQIKEYYSKQNAVKGPFLPIYAQLKF